MASGPELVGEGGRAGVAVGGAPPGAGGARPGVGALVAAPTARSGIVAPGKSATEVCATSGRGTLRGPLNGDSPRAAPVGGARTTAEPAACSRLSPNASRARV